ncbi:surface carbohydrate biosynthesis protein [Desulfonatronovibrio hydrogenovorans]|uniref:surface carbohydrate biosynthesis protein n=1 Tax=Desulfonatronovibrio hydrogenovorans TaxID=53245 RepID=UPI0012370A7A|nr:surface carbohydrate biosynthesis protein [Desulfonatronovibrio hydrogenovorans]
MNRSDKKPIIYILMEIKSRELEGRFLLALEAANRGFRVVFGHKSAINTGLECGCLPPGCYLDKSLTRGKEGKLASLADIGCLIASQDEESGLLSYSYDKFLSVRSTPETVGMASLVFCWGEFDHLAWSDKYSAEKEKFYPTGSPRIDYWRHDFLPYFQHHIDNIKQQFGKYVLVSSNFASAHGYMTLEERIAQGRKNGSIVTADDEQRIRNIFEDSKRMFALYAQLIRDLAKKYPDISFVVRPHPVEKIEGWKNVLPTTDNIHVLFEGGISSWERAACAVIHNGCTTGMEAYVSGTPAIAYTPFESPINREIPNKLSIKCTTEDEVSDVLARIFSGEEVNDHRTPENDELIRNRLANVEGDTAAKKIVDVLETLDVPESPPIRLGLTGWKMSAKKELARLKNRIKGVETKAMRKFPGLRLKELKQIQNNLSKVNSKYNECSIKHLYGDVFVVEKN